MVSFSGILGLGGGQPKLRPFKVTDMVPVLEIIEQHDEDDAEEAYENLQESHEGMFVLSKGGTIIGVTGADADEHVDGICWLSWTYVHEDYQGQGFGRMMFEQLRAKLEDGGVRRLFISTSDYMEDGVDLYAKAKAFYQAMGAQLELKINDYHDKNEARFVYGLDVLSLDETGLDFEKTPEASPHEGEAGSIFFTGLDPLPESKGGFGMNWVEEIEGENQSEKVPLETLKMSAQQHGARFLVVAPPSVFEKSVEQSLKENGFKKVGKLKDYYEKSIDQVYWICFL